MSSGPPQDVCAERLSRPRGSIHDGARLWVLEAQWNAEGATHSAA